MGCKRPFEEMEFEEFRFKHPRQLEHSNKPASFSEVVSCYRTPQDVFTTGKDEGGTYKFQLTEMHEKVTDVKIPPFAENYSVTSNPFSLVADGEEDAGVYSFDGFACKPDSLDLPRPFVPVDDAYSSSMNCSPRRHVPVGLNHQASIPIWRGKVDDKKINPSEVLESKAPKNCNVERVMGACVVPMPDLNIPNWEGSEVGMGRVECSCLDAGSIKCVRKHVGESRENLRKSLGEKKFVSLGFCEMGEEVSFKWSEEEEHNFHEVVYSNPVSMGRKFWNLLSEVFPYRSKKEIVSYYFNVFMLRKRASQNRSRSLDIDSDDDEWCGSSESNREVQVSNYEEDSVIESLGDEQDRHHREEDFSEEECNDDDNSDDGDDNAGQDRECMAKEHGFIDHGCEGGPVHKISDHFQDDCVFHDDSCLSFECQINDDVRTENAKCPNIETDTTPHVGHIYLSDSFDSKVWDARYNISCPKSCDLSPWDMIEDIFGDGKDLGKSKDD